MRTSLFARFTSSADRQVDKLASLATQFRSAHAVGDTAAALLVKNEFAESLRHTTHCADASLVVLAKFDKSNESDDILQLLIADVLEKFAHFSSDSMVQFVQLCPTLPEQVGIQSLRVAAPILLQVPVFTPSQISSMLKAYTKLRVRDDSLLNSFLPKLVTAVRSLKPLEIADALYTVAKLQPENSKLLQIFAKFARLKIRDLKTLAFLAHSAASAKLEDFALADLISREIRNQEFPGNLTLSDLTFFASFLSKTDVWEKLAIAAAEIFANEKFPENSRSIETAVFFVSLFAKKNPRSSAAQELASLVAPHVTRDAGNLNSTSLLHFFSACARAEFRDERNLKSMISVLRERNFFENSGNDKFLMKLSSDAAALGAVIPEVEKKFPAQKFPAQVWFKPREVFKKKKLSGRKLRKM